jgi:para-nitrobenzyl esterase
MSLRVDRWSQIRNATQFSAACAQRNNSGYTFPYDTRFDEDCLTLNIWAPSSASPGDNLPVSVWIHGIDF